MDNSTLDFTGRVAVVTGSGRGIGRAYADLLAARGAKVMINDIGARTGGGGGDTSLAINARDDIRTAGGIAEADTSDISTADRAAALIQHTVDAFGRLDIVVNNAGIFTQDAFPDIDCDTVRRHFDVHIGGSLNVTRAAWPHLVDAQDGRVVLTTSTSALGAIDTVAYGTAKAAMLGLGRALAMVGAPAGIKVNMVAPMAMTRMMSIGAGWGDTPPEVPDRDPSLVAPLVALLCHRSCPTSGETFVSGMRRVSRLYIAESGGYTHPGLDLTPEIVRDQWARVFGPENAKIVPDTMTWSAINEGHLTEHEQE